MASPYDTLPVPESYATPAQLQQARDFYAYLQHGKGQLPVRHWTQGLSNMFSALVGGAGQHLTAREEDRMHAMKARDMPTEPGMLGAAPPTTPGGTRKADTAIEGDEIPPPEPKTRLAMSGQGGSLVSDSEPPALMRSDLVPGSPAATATALAGDQVAARGVAPARGG